MSSFRWGMVACLTPTNSQVTVSELRQHLFSAHCSTVVFFCFAFCFCLSPPGWEKVLSLEMMWTWLGALSFDVNGLYESQTTFPFLWVSNLNQNKPVDPFLDSSPIQNQACLVSCQQSIGVSKVCLSNYEWCRSYFPCCFSNLRTISIRPIFPEKVRVEYSNDVTNRYDGHCRHPTWQS